MGSRGIKKRGTNPPDQAEWSWFLRREEKALGRIAQPILRTILRLQWRILRQVLNVKEVVLRNDRHDRAQNEIPILIQGDGNDRLNIERELVAVVRRPIAEVLVGLEWHAD